MDKGGKSGFSWQTMKLNDMRVGGSKMQYRNTRQRKIVLEAVQEHHDHPSADQIYLEIRAKDQESAAERFIGI